MVETIGERQRRADAEQVWPGELPAWLTLDLTVRDPDVIATLAACESPMERDEFALAALKIGVLALRQARGQVDSDAVRRESQRMLTELERQLTLHSRGLNERLEAALKDYFDPQDGRFAERVHRLVKQDGELEGLLRRQVGDQDSVLCRTLVQHFGQDSPLMRQLSPDQSQGLLARMRQTLEEQLGVQREHVLRQFSLDNEESALSRLVGQLTLKQGELTRQLGTKIDEVVREFSLDEQDSALSRLVRNVDQAQRTISAQFSLDDEGSALARLRKELQQQLEEQATHNRAFQEHVKVALEKMATRREEREKTTRRGVEFEAAVGEFLEQEAQRAGHVLEAVGQSCGQIRNCRVGDFVVTLSCESAGAGARVVVEAKEDKSYTIAKMLEEMKTARGNRQATVGLFVCSRKTAPAGMEPITRHGEDVLATWDAEDAQSDVLLRAALSLVQGLAVRAETARGTEAAEIKELDRAILEIEKRASELEKVKDWAETIGSRAHDIQEHVRKSRDALLRQVTSLRESLEEMRQAER